MNDGRLEATGENAGDLVLPKRTRHADFGFDDDAELFFATDRTDSRRVYVSDRKRLSLYRRGIAYRRNWILSDYRIPPDLVGEDDVVIDIGANIGEIGCWATDAGARYIAFEPDPMAFAALQRNVSAGDVIDVCFISLEFVEFIGENLLIVERWCSVGSWRPCLRDTKWTFWEAHMRRQAKFDGGLHL